MSAVDDYIKQNAELHQFAAEVARIISGIPPMPEFSTERLTVDDVSKMIGMLYLKEIREKACGKAEIENRI